MMQTHSFSKKPPSLGDSSFQTTHGPPHHLHWSAGSPLGWVSLSSLQADDKMPAILDRPVMGVFNTEHRQLHADRALPAEHAGVHVDWIQQEAGPKTLKCWRGRMQSSFAAPVAIGIMAIQDDHLQQLEPLHGKGRRFRVPALQVEVTRTRG